MIALMTTIAAIITVAILFLIFQTKNFLIRSSAIVCFVLLIPIVFGNFINLTGEPRRTEWDIFWNRPEKMEVVSYFVDEDELTIYLWLLRENNIPVYYVLNSNSKEINQLRKSFKKAKIMGSKVYYKFTSETEKSERGNERFRVKDIPNLPEKENSVDEEPMILQNSSNPDSTYGSQPNRSGYSYP